MNSGDGRTLRRESLVRHFDVLRAMTGGKSVALKITHVSCTLVMNDDQKDAGTWALNYTSFM